MAKILKFDDYQMRTELTHRFIECVINPLINESTENEEGIISILKNLQKDLKFNVKLIFTFGTGIASMYPIVLGLIENQNLKIDTTPENIALLTLTSVVILALETEKNKEISKDEIKFLLNELKLRGIGNGIVKKMVSSFKSIGNLLKILFKNTSTTVRHLIDMFGYTSLLIPTMNALSSIVSDYNWTMDTIIGNLSSLGVGVLTFLAKNGWDYLVKKLKSKTKINPEIDRMKIKGEEELDYGQDFYPTGGNLIKEQ